jgi:hypothetical protein
VTITLDRTEHGVWFAHAHVDKFSPEQTAWAARRLHGGDPAAEAALLRERRGALLYADDFARFGLEPEEGTADAERNLLTTAGITRMLTLTVAGGGQGLTNTATRLGTGDGAGTAAVGDTDLSAVAGSTHRWFQVMDPTFPSVATNVLTAKASFGTADGNYAWNEWGLDVGTPTVTSGNTVAALLFNHKTSAALGTKGAGSTWALTVTVTIT